MAIKSLSTTYQNEVTSALQHDPRLLDQVAYQNYGMSAAQLNSALSCLIPISQGRMPDQAGLKFLEQSAKAQYGWDRGKTMAAVKEAVGQPSPQGRIAFYLQAGGNRITQEVFDNVSNLVQQSAHYDMTTALETRLENSQSNHTIGRDQFDGMTAPKHVIEKSKQDQSLRDNLTRLMGDKPSHQKTFDDKRSAVLKAREQLADRLDVDVFKSTQPDYKEPTLRDTLAMQTDLHIVNKASEEVGMGSVFDQTEESLADQKHLMDSSHDITSDLRD